MIINYYVLDYEDNDELLAFKSIHEDLALKSSYERLKGEGLITNLFCLNNSIIPFINNEFVLKLLRKDDISSLPIVEINNEIVTTGKLLSIEELSNITEIGITIQKKELKKDRYLNDK